MTTTLPVARQAKQVPDNFKKAVGVVQVAMGSLGFLHRKVYNVLLANAQEGLKEGDTTFTLPVSVIAELAGFNSNDRQMLYEHGRDMVKTLVEFVDFDGAQKKGRRKKNSRGATTLLASFREFENGTVTYSYSPDMVRLLQEPEQFVWIALSTQRKFSSKYELNLYENCLRYVDVGSTGFKDVERWRKLLGATDATYDEFKHLNSLVLKPTIKGVNEKSGILLEPEFEREKRKVARIKFSIRENEQLSLLDYASHREIRATQAFMDATEMGLLDVQAIHWIEARGAEYVAEAVEYVKKQGKKAKKPSSYLLNALNQGYGEKTPAEREKAVKAVEIQTKRQKAESEKERVSEAAKNIEIQYHDAVNAEGRRLLSERMLEEQTAFLGSMPQRSNMLALDGYRQRWKSLEGDILQLVPANRVDGFILSEIGRLAFAKWGDAGAWSFEAFCSDQGVDTAVLSFLKQNGKFK